ncbi:MAG: dTDP-glucose 4,6-dehydratase [Candidatus Thiodiazotropha sp. (ex Lucina aurantia)]|uniref:dTDP-glucose 4,6-dehydratase n=1 Tax=Candidatus Thiodiazotropha taylori TaxID=2792791 RepID=A0A9E4MW78_9GAMM|nr:dTDP-glucose 4,6-dehydratase [Candidatus Thiodiazotropha sp. (ex Lucina pensylvanica)]MBT3015003.1 dTDP-glucose 4,6-dehydratase [Candidatus Thiodiazotropha taylori]MBT3038396.1 dTDP-glucose 4,6-dehydratase [Candidatus Thiodiazotropha sp. (ex Codakia orbicularis)]MBV2102913.1 dTDP-glucose 4,6-dehydratase [Candidatus Thiodiazotropha sp. (ex Lucina aurantia)]MCG7861388.1 dTDP-glucose 4,6-dehydratase [Candidatus Thiodiazotropha endolucinida]
MQTIIVTGGAGFIGGNFVHHLLSKQDVQVVNLDALTYAGNLDTLQAIMKDPRHHFIQGKIQDRELVTGLFERFKPVAIVNFAAESHVDRSIDGPAEFIDTNIGGTFNLLECARTYWAGLAPDEAEAFRFLHVSTDEVYGSLGDEGKFTETTSYAPNSPYSASKAASDHLVRAWYHTYGMPVLTTNCSNNYGPYQFPEKLIPLFIQKALAGEDLPIYGDGSNVRDWLYVEDHCRAIWRVLEAGKPGEVYNVGGNNEMSNLEVIEMLCALLDELVPDSPFRPHTQLKKFVKDRPGHDQRYAIDATKLHHELGWTPDETFATGLKKTVSWYLNNETWCQRVMDGSYRGERLGQG